MNEKTKNILLGVLIIGLVSMTVAYAALSQTLNIGGTARISGKNANWNVHFAAVTSGQAIAKTGYATTASESITITDTQVTTPEVTLKAPGDQVVFRFLVKNDGVINAALDSYTATFKNSPSWNTSETLTTEQRTTLMNAVSVTLAYEDAPTTITPGTDTLAASGSRVLVLTVSLDSNCQILPDYDVTFGAVTATMGYVQAN